MSLHGHAKIELTNINTGEIKIYEKDNMITNALSKFLEDRDITNLATIAGTTTSSDNQYPFACISDYIVENYKYGSKDTAWTGQILNNMIGGVMLFSEEQEEDTNNLYGKYECLTGMATGVDTYVSTNPKRGILNAAESTALSNGYKWVWDFATDRANGIIKSICLTDSLAARSGNPIKYPLNTLLVGTGLLKNYLYNYISTNKSRTGEGLFAYGAPLKYDWENCILTCFDWTYTESDTSTGNNINYLKILKYKIDFNSTSIVKHDWFKKNLVEEHTINLTENIRTICSIAYDENYYYIIYCQGTQSSLPLKLFKININTYGIESFDIINSPSRQLYAISVYSPNTTMNGIIRDNKFYFVHLKGPSSETNDLCYISLDDFNYHVIKTDIRTEIDSISTLLTRDFSFLKLPDNSLLLGDSYRITENDTVITINTDIPKVKTLSGINNTYYWPKVIGGYNFLKPNSVCGFTIYNINSSNYYYTILGNFVILGYLATIDNIESIEKTSEQTMKITYTVTEG